MKTTLNQIRACTPCASGWNKLLKYLCKTKADDEPLLITTILDSNGLDDALWCLQAVTGHDREIRLYGVWCARQVQHLMTDPRSITALDIAEKYANGCATQEELEAAGEAWEAAREAVRVAAREAAWAAWAAGAAAREAAWAAGEAAGAAWTAGEAAWTAGAAARAAWTAGEAAWTAGAAARAAAGAAAWTAGEAAREAAWTAAWEAAGEAQTIKLRRICSL